MLRSLSLAAAAALFTLPAFADPIEVQDAYFRVSHPGAPSGAAFMVLVNSSDSDQRLLAARSDIAARVELHTHREDANGVMRMTEVEEGFAIPAQSQHALERGGDHVMFMGLSGPIEHGDTVSVTLVFSDGMEMAVAIPVDLERQPGAMGHGMSGHGQMHGHGN